MNSTVYDVLNVIGKETILEFLDNDDILIEEIENRGYIVYDEDDEKKAPVFLENIGAVLVEDVEAVLEEIKDLISRGAIGDAQHLINRWVNPKFNSVTQAKEKYENSLKR